MADILLLLRLFLGERTATPNMLSTTWQSSLHAIWCNWMQPNVKNLLLNLRNANTHLSHCLLVTRILQVNDAYEINHMWTADMKSNEEWSSQLWSQFLQLRKEAWKNLTVVQNAKILGPTISNNLTWNTHIGEIIKKGKQTHVLSCTSAQGRCPIVGHCEFSLYLCKTVIWILSARVPPRAT